MAEPLTNLERRVYHYLIDFLSENSYQPSIREIAKKFRIKSTKTVSDLLQSLASKGYIERDRSRSRGVRLLGVTSALGTQPLPYYGKVHAGEPALRPEDRLGYITVDRRFVPAENAFLLRVQGDAMASRGILDQDYVIVSPQTPPADGDVVAARIGEEANVRTVGRTDERIVLRTTRPDEREIEVGSGADCAILGVVTGVFRSFVEQILTVDTEAPQGLFPTPVGDA